jgi:hypothetical protein
MLVLFFLSSSWGCVSIDKTKPNIPFQGDYPNSLDLIQQANPVLASELLKLPEIQDGISAEEAIALEKIVKLYNDYPADFDKAFNKMYEVGLPNVRRYCSPLQALFWLAEDGKYDELTSSLHEYSLSSLLNKSWVFDFQEHRGKVLDITAEQSDEIISILDQDEQRIYEGITDLKVLNYVILIRYLEKPRKFPKEARKLIKDALKNSKYNKFMLRWKHFNIVADRLNAPELIDYYINHNITYRTYIRAHGAYNTFRFKKGHCIDAAYLAIGMLKRNGYKTFMRHVKWGPNDWIDNHCVSGILVKDGSYIIVADFNRSGNKLSGPFISVHDLDNAISKGRSISETTWGTFWPP